LRRTLHLYLFAHHLLPLRGFKITIQLALTLLAGFDPAFFMPEKKDDQHPVILFDGVCNLCSSAVQFVLKRDKKNVFRFASLQSSFGQNLLKQYHLPSKGFDSFIVLERQAVYTKSTAALRVVKQLSGAWPLLYIFSIIPAFISNTVYNFIAKNRYRWFGKKETCWIASPELKNKFLD
jgi:predicted DCC family thiol-disulfide oxidoreductase YuxK